jgi:type IV pilus assembly protein PilM
MLASLFNHSVIGLDIGASGIKIATLNKQQDKYRLENCDIRYFDKECFNKQGEATDTNCIENLVTDILQQHKNKTRHAVLSVPHRLIASDIISVSSDLPIDEKNYQLELEANRMLPPGSMASFDYFTARNNLTHAANTNFKDNTGDQQQFKLMAVPKNLVDDKLTFVQKNKIKPIVVDSDAFAALRNSFYIWGLEGSIDKVVTLLHLGHSASYMFVVYNQEVIYEQNLLTNGEQLTQTIMNYYNMSYSDAEIKKRTALLPSGYQEDVLSPYIENTVIDIIQGIQNFFYTSNLSRIDNLFLSGGHALIENLSTQIAKKTHINTQIFNPFVGLLRNTSINESLLRKDMPSYTTAIGLALRGFDE